MKKRRENNPRQAPNLSRNDAVLVLLRAQREIVQHEDRPANSEESYDGRKTRKKSFVIPPRPFDSSFFRSRNLHRSYIPAVLIILKLQKLLPFGLRLSPETRLSVAFH